MIPFRFTLAPGQPIVDQVVFAATRAFVSGALRPGDPFPSVRAMAGELKINPNTAAKVVQHLIAEGWLEASPGKGAVVARPPSPTAADRKRLIDGDIEHWVVEAKRVGLDLETFQAAIAARWRALNLDGDKS